ncbi:MAG: hypothetical protein AB7K24_30545 [Gemmataceae bacterium]
MRRLCALIVSLALVLPAVASPDSKRGPPPDRPMPKHLVEDAGQFFRSAKGALDRLAGPALQAIYLAGVRDGVIGASVVLILFYLLFLQPRKT